jgi:chromosome segregation ATPase
VVGESLQINSDWKKVEEALAEIRACRADSLRFFTETLDEFDALFACVESQAKRFEERQKTPAVDAAALQQSVIAATIDDSVLEKLTERTDADRAEMRKMQEGMQGQLARLAAIATELASAKNEFQGMREDVERCSQETASLKNATAQQTAQNDRFSEMERDYSALQQERASLEKELEDLRNRAADLTHSLADQKRQSATQQTQWNDELKKMRGMMETVTRRLVSDDSRPQDREAAPRPTPETVDPALSSVLAQFEMLQQDRAKRTG